MGKKKTLAHYFDNLDADSMTGNWTPAGAWHKVHGDCKSSTGGKWTMQTMTSSSSNITYKVRVLENGQTIKNLEYSSQPSFETIVSDLQAGQGSSLLELQGVLTLSPTV